MYRIGIIAQPGKGLASLHSLLHQAPRFETSTFTQPWRAAHALQKQKFDALVFHSERTGIELETLHQRIRKLYPIKPIAYVLNFSKDQDWNLPGTDTNSLLLDYTSELQDLPGVLQKLIVGQPIHHRACRRFLTAQNATVVATDDQRIGARLLNLGLRGAQVRVFNHSINKGDVVYLEVMTAPAARQRSVQATVAWSRMDKTSGGANKSSNSKSAIYLVGLEF